jgi:hypothetical protein
MSNYYAAEVRLLESFDLGKNTGKRAGIKVKVFDKGEEGTHGRQLGTIGIGQGSFQWWPPKTKRKTTRGKRPPPVRLSWSEFADLMNKVKQNGR